MSSVTGTFEATGESAPVYGEKILVSAIFAGAATVSIQWYTAGAWRDIIGYSALTASFNYIYEGPTAGMRLQCEAHTADVDYELRAE